MVGKEHANGERERDASRVRITYAANTWKHIERNGTCVK